MQKRGDTCKILLMIGSCLLAACSDNLIYSETTSRMRIEVLNSDTAISVGESITFEAEIHTNNPNINEIEYGWIINSEDRKWHNPATKIFEESGIYEAKFYAIDYFNDTLSVKITINVTN